MKCDFQASAIDVSHEGDEQAYHSPYKRYSIRWLRSPWPLDVGHSITIVFLYDMPHAKWLPRELTTIREEPSPSPSSPYFRLAEFEEGCPEIGVWVNHGHAESPDQDEVDPEDLALTPDAWPEMRVIEDEGEWVFKDEDEWAFKDEDEWAIEDEDENEPLLFHDMEGRSSSDGLPVSPSDRSSNVEVVIDRDGCNLTERLKLSSPQVHRKELLESLSLVALDHVGGILRDRGGRVPKRRLSDSSFEEGELDGNGQSMQRTDFMRAVDRNKLPRLNTGHTTFHYETITPVGPSNTFMEILAERSDGDGTWYKVQWRETWMHEGDMPAITPIRQDHHLRHGRPWQVVPPRPTMI